MCSSPRQGEPSDDVRLRGEPKLVNKLKEELEKVVGALRDRVVVGVDIPAGQHRALIGRGGQHLNDFQAKFDVMVQFPGSRSYAQAGEPENADELSEVDQANIVKISGSKVACKKAAEELKVSSFLISLGVVAYLSRSVTSETPYSRGRYGEHQRSAQIPSCSDPARKYLPDTQIIWSTSGTFQDASKGCCACPTIGAGRCFIRSH